LERISLNQRFKKVKLTQVEPEISNGDVAFCYIGLLVQGKGDSDHIEPLFSIPTPTIVELYHGHGTSEQFHSTKIDIVDRQLMQRLSGTALDFLVVAAISTIHLSVILESFFPFIIVVIAGIAWNVLCVIWLARRLLPDAWFERAIAEMGQSMGVTATGLLLLRVVDPEAETPAFSSFGYKQLLHEPFMGGGLWTSMAMPLAITLGPWPVFLISVVAIGVWCLIWGCLFRKGMKK
jgi:Na+/glutamate symporter